MLLGSDRPYPSLRAAAIELRQAQLLAERLAINGSDVAARQRLEEIKTRLNPEARDQLRPLETRLTVYDFITKSSPHEPEELRKSLQELAKSPATVAEAVKVFIDRRYSDPFKAAEAFLLLESTFASTHGEIVSSEDHRVFKRWCAGHLNRGELYELDLAKVKPTLGILSDLAAVGALNAPHPDDHRDLQEMQDALVSELVERPKELKAHEARLNSRLVTYVPGNQELYNVLRIYAERAGAPELKDALLTKALDGLSVQLDFIDSARLNVERTIDTNARSVSALRKLGGKAEVSERIPHAKLAIARSYKAVELRLGELLLESPESARAKLLLRQAKAGLVANPPPADTLSEVVAASCWADPYIANQIRTILPGELKSVESSTNSANVARFAIERDKARPAGIGWAPKPAPVAVTRVDVYGRMSCPRTTQVIDIYKQMGVMARFHDVDTDFLASSELRKAHLKDNLLPLVKVNGRSLNGRGEELSYERILTSCGR